MRALSRRELLGAGVVAAGAGVVGACSSGKHATAPTSTTSGAVAAPATTTTCAPARGGLKQIEHVVFVIQENRSFDHYFGTYRGVHGFNDQGRFAQPPPPGGQGSVLPFHLDTATTGASCTNDITHDWGPQHQAWNGGAMDGWATTHAAVDGADGATAMGYYTRADIPYYYALADAFTICDAYHCSVLGPTDPNRLFSISATNDPAGTGGGPVINTVDLIPGLQAQYSKTWTTMNERLETAGVSWKCYDNPAFPQLKNAVAISNNKLFYFKQFADPTTSIHKRAFSNAWPADFQGDVTAGTLPSVSWVFSQPGQDEHPPASPQVGQLFVAKVLGILMSNPAVWAKTVVFVTYDENGGFFDHVAPPVAPPGTPGEELTVSPLPADAGGFARPVGLGFRVPMLVLSPFSRGGWVCSERFDHTSMLRFLETRFGVEVPNLSAWRRSVTGDLTSALDMTAPDVSAPSLPTPAAADVTPPLGCPPHEIITNVPTYRPPANPPMPAQEPGAAKRRPAPHC
ncbi:MAG TPA: alkaline phosphatase family protein [Acidimicrobiales bacterium]|nr:alkaline phosphatase family protein [Acidimicrobiales bacterium]